MKREPVTITALKKYFTLGGFCGPDRLIQAERTSYNNSFEEIFHFGRVFTIKDLKKYFSLGGCCGPERLVQAKRASYNNSF